MNLDREIAEKVMRWKLLPASVEPESVPVFVDIEKHEMHDPDTWSPSLDIYQAMEVEAEMFKLGYEISINREEDGDYEVGFYSEAMNYFPVHNKSLSEAICRAALAALEE